MATKETQDIEWYVKNRGLATGGVDVTALTSEDIFVEQIEDLFGPKVSKNGYRYDRKPEPEIVGKILELYKRVIGKTKVLNNQINLAFARGVVAWINGAKLDWAKYAVHCNKYAENLKQTKASNLRLKVQTMGQVEKIPLQRRASRPPTTKQVVPVKLGDKEVKLRTMVSSIANQIQEPEWEEGEILEVSNLLKTLEMVLIGSKQDVLEAQKQHASNVSAFQVCKMHLEAREKVCLDSESQRSDIERELNDLVDKYRQQGDMQPRCIDSQQHSELQDIRQKLAWSVTSKNVAVSMLNRNVTKQACGHLRVYYQCILQQPLKICPVCCMNVNGWSRTNVTEVTSPLKGLRPARGVMPNSVAKVWPSANMKLNLSAAFNENVVPQIEALQTKKIGDPKPTPVQMEFPSEKENTLDDYSSDDEEFFQPGLVHYPPQPILGTGGLQHFDSITSIEDSQSESEDVLHGSNNENHSSAVGVVDPKSPPKQIKRGNNPLDPNPGCQKRVTRAELLEVALSVAAKKVQKKKRKKAVPVKYFSSFS
ncbi:unnamed protein product [Calypogeia fissa]